MLHRVRLRLVTFDVTGTLLMTKLVEHYSEIASQHGIVVSNKDGLARSFNQNFKRLEREHPVYGRHTGLGWENWWRQIVYNVFKDQDKRLSNESLDKVASKLIECYATKKCWHTYPGVLEILDYLESRGIVLGVISNFDERLDSVLVSTKIRGYFSFVLSSYTHGVEKPDPSIFEEAIRLAWKTRGISVKPEEAMHIGDTLENDYIGATNARWHAALVKHRDGDADVDYDRHDIFINENQVPRDRQFNNLRQLQTHFENMFTQIENKM